MDEPNDVANQIPDVINEPYDIVPEMWEYESSLTTLYIIFETIS